MADLFLKIDGIPGESQNPRHRGEIEVESFSWSETYLASAAGAGGGGGGGGKVHVQDLHITKQIDKASRC
jgi:type VI secretion system secreted protein Hcp